MSSQASTLRPPTPLLRSSQESDASINKNENSSQQETPKASTETARPQTASSIYLRCQQFLSEAVDTTNPSLRYIGSQSSLKSSRTPSDRNHESSFTSSRPLSVTFLTYEEQRYAGKNKANISHTTKNWNPFATEAVGKNKDVERMNIRNSGTSATEATISTDTASESGNTTLYERPESSALDREMRALTQDETTTAMGRSEGSMESKEENEREVSYPEPLGLFILIMGIALSVFLISLDRTIITTVSLITHI